MENHIVQREKCYIFGGDCAPILFRRREAGRRMPDDALIGIWWAVVTLFPLPFFIIWSSWVPLAVYVGIAGGWHAMHHFIACKRCKNTSCPLNPDKCAQESTTSP